MISELRERHRDGVGTKAPSQRRCGQCEGRCDPGRVAENDLSVRGAPNRGSRATGHVENADEQVHPSSDNAVVRLRQHHGQFVAGRVQITGIDRRLRGAEERSEDAAAVRSPHGGNGAGKRDARGIRCGDAEIFDSH